MAKDVTFAKVVTRCSTALAVAAVVAGGWTVVALLHTTGRAPWAAELPIGAVVGNSVMLLAVVAAALASWSLHSHQLALDHGLVPLHSTTWSTYGWFVPLVQWFLPFTILRQRCRSYQMRADKALLWLQALCLGTVLLWGWMALRIVPGSFDRWGTLATAATTLCIWRLRGLVVRLSQVQMAVQQRLTA
jgi:hypothetical protein